MMLVLVTGVGALIHIYSLGYMRDDDGQVALLRVALALHVLDARHRPREQLRDDVHLLGAGRRQLLSAASATGLSATAPPTAANKAFLTNRIGDFGFMLGILMVWASTGSSSSAKSPVGWVRSPRIPAISPPPRS
jgi:NADH-quinone oxidoreductase subunit L